MNDPQPGPTARSALVGLALLLAIALFVRWPALGRNLPCDPEPDAVVVKQALYLDAKWRGGERTVPNLNRQYPPLLGALLAALPGPLLAPAPEAVAPADELDAASRPFRIGRGFVLALGLGAIPLTFLLARRALGARHAALAAGLVALSSLHALYSTQARPHAPLATLCALALLALAARLRAPSASSTLGAGAACALCIACLHNGFAILAPFAAVEFLLVRRRGLRSLWGALGVALPVAAAALVSYPELFGRAAPFQYSVPHVGEQLNLSGHLLRVEDFDGAGFALVLRFLSGQEPVLLALLIGAVALVPRALRGGRWRALGAPEHAEVLVALVFAAAYLAAIGVYARTFGRFLLPVLPPLACAGAWAAREWFASRGALARWVPLATLALAALPSARVAWLWTRPTTLEQAGTWLRTNLPSDALVALPLGVDVELPIDPARDAVLPVHLRTPWTARLLRYPDVAAGLPGPRTLHSGFLPGMDQAGTGAEALSRELRSRRGAGFVLVEPDEQYAFDPRQPRAPGAPEPAYRPEIGRRRYPRGHHPPPGAAPLASFGAADAPRLADAFGYSLDDCWPWTIWRLRCFGQRLEVYRDWPPVERDKNPENASGK